MLQVWETWRALDRALARASAWPELRELRLLGLVDKVDASRWKRAVDQVAGRDLARFIDFYHEPVAFQPVFREYRCGRLPDGRAVFVDPDDIEGEPLRYLIFGHDGNIEEEHELPLPDSLEPFRTDCYRHPEKIRDYLHESIGVTPAFIRVNEVRFENRDYPYTYRYYRSLEESIESADDPDEDLNTASDPGPGGYGARVYCWVKDGGFVFDCGNDWWCGRDGTVHST